MFLGVRRNLAGNNNIIPYGKRNGIRKLFVVVGCVIRCKRCVTESVESVRGVEAVQTTNEDCDKKKSSKIEKGTKGKKKHYKNEILFLKAIFEFCTGYISHIIIILYYITGTLVLRTRYSFFSGTASTHIFQCF